MILRKLEYMRLRTYTHQYDRQEHSKHARNNVGVYRHELQGGLCQFMGRFI